MQLIKSTKGSCLCLLTAFLTFWMGDSFTNITHQQQLTDHWLRADKCYYEKIDGGAPELTVSDASCDCHKETKKCFGILRWSVSVGKTPVSAYRLLLPEDPDNPYDGPHTCYRLPSNATTFNYTIDDLSDGEIPYLLSTDPSDKHTAEDNLYINCPTKISIKKNTFHLAGEEITEGDTHVFTCGFEGYPLPDTTGDTDIMWFFTPLSNKSGDSLKDERSLVQDQHINITRQSTYTTLTIINAAKIHEGTYKCLVQNYLGAEFGDSKHGRLLVKKRKKTLKKSLLGPMIAIVSAALILGTLLLSTYFYLRKKRSDVPVGDQFQQACYVSHCAVDEKQVEKLLKFAYDIESLYPGVSMVIDLTRQTEINRVGGFSQWIPQEMEKADKILVILTNEYVDALHWDGERCVRDQSVIKVAAEYQFIQNLLHESGQVTEKLVLCWMGEKLGTLPPVFENRCCYMLPTKKDDLVHDNTLVNVLFGVSSVSV